MACEADRPAHGAHIFASFQISFFSVAAENVAKFGREGVGMAVGWKG